MIIRARTYVVCAGPRAWGVEPPKRSITHSLSILTLQTRATTLSLAVTYKKPLGMIINWDSHHILWENHAVHMVPCIVDMDDPTGEKAQALLQEIITYVF